LLDLQSQFVFTVFLTLCIMLSLASCDNGNKVGGTFTVNGTVHEILYENIVYWTGERAIALLDTDGYNVQFIIQGYADPLQTANHIPMGSSPAITADYLSRVDNGLGVFDETSIYSAASLTVSGKQGTTLTVKGSFAFTSPSSMVVDDFDCSGPYGYSL
jgi:hypothetical protein